MFAVADKVPKTPRVIDLKIIPLSLSKERMKEALEKRQRGIPGISGSSFAILWVSFHGTGIYLIYIPDSNVQGEDSRKL